MLYLLERDGLSEDVLKSLSYRTSLNKSLKGKLRTFNKIDLLNEALHIVDWYDLEKGDILDNVAIDYRIKSEQSIINKYYRYYPDRDTEKVFNDLLGFRSLCDSYDDIIALQKMKYFKVVDMSKGKADDDGYRGVHLYFQIDHYHYPLEIQYNTLYDRYLNDWLHDFVYKKKVMMTLLAGICANSMKMVKSKTKMSSRRN